MELYLYKDKNADIESRIADLISRMTLDEKVKQIDQYGGGDITYTDRSMCKNDYEPGVYGRRRKTPGVCRQPGISRLGGSSLP